MSTTQKGSTSNPSTGILEDRIYQLENKVDNLIRISDQMTANWKIQYIISSMNQDEIGRMKNNIFDLQKNSETKDKLLDEIVTENLQLRNVTNNMQLTIDGILKNN